VVKIGILQTNLKKDCFDCEERLTRRANEFLTIALREENSTVQNVFNGPTSLKCFSVKVCYKVLSQNFVVHPLFAGLDWLLVAVSFLSKKEKPESATRRESLCITIY